MNDKNETWTVIQADDAWEVVTENEVVARVGTTVRTGTISRAKVSKARATLIAAAPDMLAALQLVERALKANPSLGDVLLYSDGDHGDRIYPFDAVGPAIAKATGGDK